MDSQEELESYRCRFCGHWKLSRPEEATENICGDCRQYYRHVSTQTDKSPVPLLTGFVLGLLMGLVLGAILFGK